MPISLTRSLRGSGRFRPPLRTGKTLTAAVSGAIAEVGSPEACLILVENLQAEIAPCSFDRIVERFGHLAVIREAMIARGDLPAPTHQSLLAKLSQTLAGMVGSKLGEERAL